MMNYNLYDVPVVNKTYNGKPSNGQVISTVNGEIKALRCSHEVLEEVLSLIDGTRRFEDIENSLQESYPLVEIRNFISTLVKEEIIHLKLESDDTIEIATVGIVGSGRVASILKEAISQYKGFTVTMTPVEEFLLDQGMIDSDVAIFAPNQCTYEEMLDFNKLMISKNVPFIQCYYDGSELALGPFVVPGKTACLECQTMYHIKNINNKIFNGKLLDTNDIKPLYFSHEIPSDFKKAQILYAADLVGQDILNCLQQENLNFADTRKCYKPNSHTFGNSHTYYPTTECKCCRAINTSFTKWNSDLKPHFNKKTNHSEKEILYKTGGFRSKTEEETKQLIDETLERIGLKINVKRAVNNPFNHVLPSFSGVFEDSHSNKTPYFFRKTKAWGKGLTEMQSYFSAAFEMFEHISRQYVGETPIVEATYKEVEQTAIDMDPISNSIQNKHTSYDKFDPNTPIDWVWAKSLVTGEYKLVPALMVFMDDVNTKGRFYGGSSTGLGSATTIDDAVLHALFEIIEHDAWMIGQANKFVLPQLDYKTSSNKVLKERIETIKDMGYQVITRDYTNDLGIPVFRSWIVNPNNDTHFAFSGFGASLSPEIAFERSITEAMQTDALVDPNNPVNSRMSGAKLLSRVNSIYYLSYLYDKDIKGKAPNVSMSDKPNPEIKSVNQAIKYVIEQLKEKLPGCDVLFVDLTKDSINIPTVRVIVTGDIQRLNHPLVSVSPRTFNFGINMGYSNKPAEYRDLFLGDYPH
jgi:oxazoline/thiazoline synthase